MQIIMFFAYCKRFCYKRNPQNGAKCKMIKISLIGTQYQLYELDLKWDLFIGYSRHFNSRCVYRKYVV